MRVAIVTLALIAALGGCQNPNNNSTFGDPKFTSSSLKESTPSALAAVAILAQQWAKWNEACGGGDKSACDQRNKAKKELKAAGWCYSEGATSSANSVWTPCGHASDAATATDRAAPRSLENTYNPERAEEVESEKETLSVISMEAKKCAENYVAMEVRGTAFLHEPLNRDEIIQKTVAHCSPGYRDYAIQRHFKTGEEVDEEITQSAREGYDRELRQGQ
jgi:hypothetical protein